MLFSGIAVLNEDYTVSENMFVGTTGPLITWVDTAPPPDTAPYGEVYPGKSRLLMPGFYNAHAHSPMTLMRGWGEGLPLQRWLNERIFPYEAKMTGEDAYWGTMLAIAEGLRFGIVSTTDMYNFCPDMARAYLDTGAKANIGRHIACFGDENLKDLEAWHELDAFRREFHGAGEGRILADASLHAEYTSTEKVARQLAEYAAANSLRMHVHVSETELEKEECKARHGGKTPPAYLAACGIFDVPATAAHCVWLEEGDFDILKEKNVTVASCPASNLKLASGFANTPRMAKDHIPLALGTDSVASNNSLNYLGDLKLLALTAKAAFRDATAITPAQALAAAGRMGAQAQGRHTGGWVANGCAADLVVLNTAAPNMAPAHNVPSNIVYAATGAEVCLTMVDGRVLYKNGEYLSLDIEQVKQNGTAAAMAVKNRI